MTTYNLEHYSQELDELLADPTIPFKDLYTELYRIFNEILAEGTASNKIEFASSFARFTYIAQQTGLDRSIIAQINGMRSRCKQLHTMARSEAERCFLYDLKSVVQFLLAITEAQSSQHGPLRAILSRMPAGNLIERRGQTVSDCIRVSVTDWDNTYIYAQADDFEDTIKICYNDEKNYLGNWSYIGQLLELDKQCGRTEAVQLNLVHPRFAEGVYYPEIIIYQPDYLIDISSIANCFEQYGPSPYIHLINKLKESVTTIHILLGNIAGQMLDEEVNSGTNPPDYSKSVKDFFCHNAMSIVTCSDDMSTFHLEAQNQQKNIRNIIKTALDEDKTLDLDKVLLEPSFFCEMLGLQGRMDLLHSDYRVLMEQKSGQRAFRTNSHQEKHYVQVLLYMALLHYSFHIHNDDISCFLLYSKYADGLLKEGPAPKLLFEALRIRNQITWNEFQFANGGLTVLDSLTPAHINVSKMNGNFWDNYLLPPIRDILTTIQGASPLERAYFYRMMQFVAKEQVLAKCGTAQREGSGMASIWNSTLEEKKVAGNIFDNLRIVDTDQLALDANNDGIRTITLQIPATDDDYLPNFRVSDIVILYRYSKDETPDARKGIVFRANIERISGCEITVRLRAPQKNASIFHQEADTLWAIEPDYMEASYGGIYRSLFALLKTNKSRRDLILGTRAPEADTSIRLRHDYSQQGRSPMFNDLVLGAMQAKDYYIVIGPPGTGKTSFGMLNILKETLSYPDKSALLMSFTNRAVDEICSKLVAEGIDFVRIGSDLTCPDAYKDYLLENKVAQCANAKEIKEMLLRTRVFAGNTTSLTSHKEIFALRHFSLAIIDEASQILEPQLMGILTARHEDGNAIDKFVFIGDHKQLPAVVQQTEAESAVSDAMLNGIRLTNCRNSLFERLLLLQGDNKQFVFRLNRQGRMHEEVADFPRRFFYEENLSTVPMDHQHRPLNFDVYEPSGWEGLIARHRLMFKHIDRPEHTTSYKVNQPEAQAIADAVYAVWNLYTKNQRPFYTYSTVGVIVPYRHQIAIVRHAIDLYGIPELHDITLDTVERYQGSERDVIIYGFTVQREFQIDFLTNNVFEEDGHPIDRKLNVALTRAREQMIMIGNSSLLSRNALFGQLIDYCKRGGAFY